ncbi:hypothetical protein SAMN04487969_102439 [Paenibacillus algorifonticola]|uniref:Putative phage metallopeptidase domain-containing protein n=1 Tax=Paenibacillus algorifonticola TaxID=684063 RepID=A0A1I2AEL0_9BACL|nr:putative metallopeptidase [Paenibacillus algorifonticola]SFE42147.1 hypothetical protein SAMN04487969_102439 [Paenibacillus algorifonticola]
MAKAKAAEKFHSVGREEDYEQLNDIINKHHRDFADSEFLILFKHGGWKSKGKVVFGKFKVLGDDLRSTWGKDAILYLNADMWKQMAPAQKVYVLDHALFGLDFKYDRHKDVKEAADGRPLLTTVPPDIEAYAEVIKRHGAVTEDVKRLAKSMKEMNQLTIDDIQEQPPEQPHEGVKVTVGQDGVVETVEEYDEKNQMTLEEAHAAALAEEAARQDDPMHDMKREGGLLFTDPEEDEEHDEHEESGGEDDF